MSNSRDCCTWNITVKIHRKITNHRQPLIFILKGRKHLTLFHKLNESVTYWQFRGEYPLLLSCWWKSARRAVNGQPGFYEPQRNPGHHMGEIALNPPHSREGCTHLSAHKSGFLFSIYMLILQCAMEYRWSALLNSFSWLNDGPCYQSNVV